MPNDSISISVVQFVDRTIDAERRLREAVREGDQRALVVAAQDVDRRLGEMNQFREQLNAERATYLGREMYDREHTILSDRVKILELRLSSFNGSLWMAGAAISAVVVLVNIALKVWTK